MATTDADGRAEYVRSVRENTQRLAQGLLAENEKLVALATALQVELDRYRKEREELQHQLTRIQSDGQRFRQQYHEVEQQNANLANLYVASYQMHAALHHDDVLAALSEIIVNLIGSEDFTIYEASAEDPELLVRACGMGPSDNARPTVRVGDGVVGGLVARGVVHVAGPDGERGSAEPVACVPLRIDGETTGAIVVFSLLAHRPALGTQDHELLDLLATHAATALHCARLHERYCAGGALT
ncbi:MAG: GAF domain-containing protein [Deltaproteobacteria bacterium]|nr:GAF domain-containing protein [Deltaproteobacteria bacterium]